MTDADKEREKLKGAIQLKMLEAAAINSKIAAEREEIESAYELAQDKIIAKYAEGVARIDAAYDAARRALRDYDHAMARKKYMEVNK